MKLLSYAVALSIFSPAALAPFTAHAQEKKPAIPGLTQQDQHIPNEEVIFAVNSFGGEYSRAKFDALQHFIEIEIQYYEYQLDRAEHMVQAADQKAGSKIPKLLLGILKHGERLIKDLERNETTFNLARRVVSDALIADKERTFKKYPAAAKPVAGRTDNRLPLTPEEGAKMQATIQGVVTQLGIDPAQAQKADPTLLQKIQIRLQRLFLPETSVVIPVTGEKATHKEISEHHPVRVTDRYYLEDAKTAWNKLEDFWKKRVSDDLGVDYGLKSSRSFLVFSEMDDSATSPKFEAKDAWGRKLKVKSGDESQSEVVVNRLWMALGGKYTDLTYNVRGDETTIVLPKGMTREQLETKMLMSGYQYRLANNIYSSGTITKEVFESLPKKVRETVKFDDVKGLNFVRLKEAVLEYKPDEGISFGGGAAFSSDLAAQDYVGRSSVLFNLWVGNRDAKDDNNRSAVIKFDKGDKNTLNGVPVLRNKDGKGSSFVEYQSDLGNSLGDMFAAGDLAKLKGQDFLVLKKDARGLSIRPAEPLLYVPGAWNHVTANELVQEAGNIVTLMEPLLYGHTSVDFKNTQLGWIVSQTNWPAFMQLALANRLVERTRGIIKVLEEAGLRVQTRDGRTVSYANTREFAPDFTLTTANINSLAKEVNINVPQLIRSLGARPLVKGQLNVQDKKTKELFRLLETERYPSGLGFRVSRTRDHKPQLVAEDIVGATLMDIFKRPSAEDLTAQEVALKKIMKPSRNDGRPDLPAFKACEKLLDGPRK